LTLIRLYCPKLLTWVTLTAAGLAENSLLYLANLGED